MLDAGPSREHGKHRYIPPFESSAIRKLLRSPDYIGRYYSRKDKDHEKYIKNKQICDLIDKLRYEDPPRKNTRGPAFLDSKGYPYTKVDGGMANTSYCFVDPLDLGSSRKDTEASAFLHYKDYPYTKLDGGIASTSYGRLERLDLGSSRKNNKDSAILHYDGYHYSTLDGGMANTCYGSLDRLDLGTSRNIDNSAFLDYNGYPHNVIDGGTANTSYLDSLDLGGPRNSAVLDYNGYPYTNLDGGMANTSYGTLEPLDLGNTYPPKNTNYPPCL